MATRNGPWQNYARIEWSNTVGSVSQNTTSINVTVIAYLRMDQYRSSYHTGQVRYSGRWGSGSKNVSHALDPNQRAEMHRATVSVTLTDSAQTLSYSLSADHYAYGAPHTTGDTWSFTVPARYARTPSGLTITRNSDTSHRLNWTRNSTYTAVVVQRREASGSGWSSWSQVGRPTGNASTYTDTTTRANRRYQYRVAGVGGSGQSGWSNTTEVYTTPAAVSAVTAQKVGSDIEVTATGLPPYATGYRIEDNGVQVATGVTSFPWLHSSPNPSITHTYTVYAERGSLRSAGTVSNTVQLQAPPLAPSGLAPNGGVRASDQEVRLSWVHNPVDTTAQTGYWLQHRAPGGAWESVVGTTASFVDVPLPVGVREWQVRTRGAHASYGPNSPIATVTVVTRPGVAVQGDGGWDRPILTVEWSYTQDEARPQSAWQAELYDSENELLELRSGAGAATTATFNTRLLDGGAYTVRVRAATGEVWSEWSPLEIAVEFVPPAPPAVSGGWDDEAGTVELTVAPGDGEVATDLLTIERSVDGGGSWQAWITEADFTEGEMAVTDHRSLSCGTTLYRVAAIHSVTGAAATALYEVVADSAHAWLSGGPDFSIHARLPFAPAPEIETGRNRAAEHYDGREKPVAYAGGFTSLTYTLSGLVGVSEYEPSAFVDDMVRLAQHPSPLHMVRDPHGRIVIGVLSSIPMPRQNRRDWWGYSFTLTETDE